MTRSEIRARYETKLAVAARATRQAATFAAELGLDSAGDDCLMTSEHLLTLFRESGAVSGRRGGEGQMHLRADGSLGWEPPAP